MTEEDREAVQSLQDTLIEDIMTTSDEEIMAEIAEDGRDADREAERLSVAFQRIAGKARMTAAKLAVARDHSFAAPSSTAHSKIVNDREVRIVTMAARHGGDQTERDIQSASEDMAELAMFQEGRGPKT